MSTPTLPSSATLSPKPFTVSIPQKEIDRLHQLLDLTPDHPETYENVSGREWHDPATVASVFGGQEESKKYYGLTGEWIKKTRKYWREEYDWRKTEEHINSFPAYTAPVPLSSGGSMNLHFVFLPAPGVPIESSIPVCLIHGWPGSYLEFLGLVSELRRPGAPPFTIVIPSCPGYAFSDPPPKDRDWGFMETAEVMDSLMVGLGFGVGKDGKGGYFVQAGDTGSMVSRLLFGSGRFSSCVGCHLNMLRSKWAEMGEATVDDMQKLLSDPKELELVKRRNHFMGQGLGYGMEHGTRPSTIGMVVASNPVALLAWIGEKLLEWTDPTQPPLPLDTILTVVTLWWFTETFPKSIYIYREDFNKEAMRPLFVQMDKKPVGYGHSAFKWEILAGPKAWAEKEGKLEFWRLHDKGGHFAAMEVPQLLATDLIDYVNIVLAKQA